MKKLLLVLIKVGISVAILAFLVYQAIEDDAFTALHGQSKNWWLLAGAGIMCTCGVSLTMIRWCFLVRALDLPFTFREAFRLGFLGYLFNLAPMGIIGGDFLKSWMLARKYPGRRARSIASVFVDRLAGLYLLFVVASAAILLTGFADNPTPKIRSICNITHILTVVGGMCIAALFIPGITSGKVTSWIHRIQYVGPHLEQLLDAVRMYRRNYRVLLLSALLSVGVHTLFATGIYLIAAGLYDRVLPWSTHLVVSPLSAATGVLPLPMGPFEYVLNYLYTALGVPNHEGFIVALGYRIISVLIATVGICYYLSSRKEVTEVLHEAELESDPNVQTTETSAG